MTISVSHQRSVYQSILEAAGNVGSTRDIPNQQVQQNVLKWMESGARGIARIREIAAELSEPAFYAIARVYARSLKYQQTYA